MRSIFLMLRKSLVVFAALAVLLGSWSSVAAMAENNAVKVQTTATNINVDGIITTLSGAITTVNANSATQYIINIQGNITMNSSAITISNMAGVTIASDTSFSGAPFSLTKSASGRHFIVIGSLTLENIILDGGGNFGGVQVNSNGKLSVMDGAVIQKCYTASTGGGIYGNTGSAITVGGTAQIIGNTAGTNGGGIYANSSAAATSTVTIAGGVISGNTATSSGGGVCGNTGSIITVSGTAQITENTAGTNGGGIFIVNTKLNISNGTISNNRTNGIGGGICSYHDFRGASSTIGTTYRSEISVINGRITGNNAANGGGIGNFNTFDSAGSNNKAECFITVSGSDIKGNSATENGGGIYNYASSNHGGSKVAKSDVSVTGGSITGNTASGNGGGIFGYSYGSGTNASCVVTVDGSDITGNSAADGGGIFGSTINNVLVNPDCRIIVNDSSISDNIATGRGGGICGDMLSKTTVTGGRISINDASNGGGIYVANQGTVAVSGGSAITGNSAPNGDGGGIYTANTSYTNLATSDTTVFSGNSARAAYFFTGAPYPSIQFASVSIPGTYVLNNYDINYMGETRIDFYTITYDANGAGGIPPSSGIYPSGATVTVAGQNTLAMDGHAFTVWNTAADGSGALFEPDNTFAITRDVTLYAQWQVIDVSVPPTYTVTYDANGGDGNYQVPNLTYGAEYTVLPLSDTGITNPGYVFQNWNTAPDGSGSQYQAGSTFTASDNLTLYAHWRISSGGNTIEDTKNSSYYNQEPFIAIKENEVPLASAENAKTEEDKNPATGAIPNSPLIGLPYLFVLISIICLFKDRLF